MTNVTINRHIYRGLFTKEVEYSAGCFILFENEKIDRWFEGRGKTEEEAIKNLKSQIKEHKEAEYPKDIEVDFNG